MSINDPISDMLTRIRNANAIYRKEVVLPFSKINQQIAEILRQEGYLKAVEIIPGCKDKVKRKKLNLVNHDQLKIELLYKKEQRAIQHIKRVSKPGQRVYINKDKIPYVLNRLGIAIISTSKGLMTNRQARKLGIGGEIICQVY